MKKADKFSTYVLRFIIGSLGLIIATLTLPSMKKEFDLVSAIAIGFILVLFLGYAFGFEKHMQKLIVGSGKEK